MSGLKKFLLYLAVLLVLVNGYLYYQGYRKEQARRLAEEQKRREEQLAQEKAKKLLEEKRAQFNSLIDQMKKSFEAGDYARVRELAGQAFKLAKEYNFPTDEIDRILAALDLKIYSAILTDLERIAEDIYAYPYVQDELKKFPRLPGLADRVERLWQKTYRNEYYVYLKLAEKAAQDGKAGRDSKVNYNLSTLYLGRAIAVRSRYALTPDQPAEDRIKRGQRELFFAFRQLQKDALPQNLY